MSQGDPQYAQAAGVLRGRILAGELVAGEKLPTERVLCDELGVSRITVRRALSILAEERLIRRQQGSGTFVSPKPTRRIPLMIDYTGSMQAHAPRLERTVRVWRWEAAPAGVADELEVREGEAVLYAVRVDAVDGVPMAWDQGYVVRAFGEGLGMDELGRVDFVETWARAVDFELASCRQCIEAQEATAADTEALGIAAGKPVLVSLELYVATGGRPAGYFVSRYDPAFISFQSTYRWDAVRPEPLGAKR